MKSDYPRKRIALLGATGSIGTQTLDVVSRQQEYFEIEVLTAHQNADLLIEQARVFRPNVVVIGDEHAYDRVFAALDPLDIKVYTGESALAQVVQMDTVDMVVTALVGYAGLIPTIKAIEAGKPIGLANKETLVVAGGIVTALAKARGVNILPIDSEHSAIFQCLTGEFHNPVEKIILTASGGPFRGMDKAGLAHVSRDQALRHPNWDMGAKITIDSATLMNKGLEVIEAKWLFGLEAEQIDVIVHPQSIIHSMVQFEDGSIKAQLGLPDMRIPIQFALGYPRRFEADYPRFDFAGYPALTFEPPDTDTFRNLALSFEALRNGGNQPCVLNAANEVAVAAFLNEKIGFLGISELIEDSLARVEYLKDPSLEDLIQTDRETRRIAQELI